MAALQRQYPQSGCFQGLYETRRIADGHDIFHPTAFISAGDESNYPCRTHFRVFVAELLLGLLVADKVRRIDIAAIDPALMLNLPAPAAVHGLAGGVGVDDFVTAVPASNHGPVAEQAAFERDEPRAQCLGQEERGEA